MDVRLRPAETSDAPPEPPVTPNDIEPGPDWWSNWRQEDYSWDGLADKNWDGWAWDPALMRVVPQADAAEECRPATLQHQWWSHRDALFIDPHDGRGYTVAHLPLAWSDGSPSPKTSGHGGEVDDGLTIAVQDLLRAAPGGAVDLSGVVFAERASITVPGGRNIRLRMKRVYAAGSLSLRDENGDAARLGELDIESSWLKKDLDIEGATIDGGMRLITHRGSEIGGDLQCQGLRLNGRLRGRFGVKRRALFDGAIFEQGAIFEDCLFFSWASFEDARFRGPAQFARAIIGDARFGGATFERFAEFPGAAFLRSADFVNAAFAGAAVFSKAAFDRGANFTGAGFGSDLHLHGARFEGAALFSGRAALATDRNPQAIVLRPSADADGWTGAVAAEDLLAAFARRSFQTIDASEAVFVRDADFSNRDILQPSSFAGARFLGDARFHGSRLHQRVNFHDARFEALDYETQPPRARLVGGRWPDVALAAAEAIRRVDSKAPLRAFQDRPDQFRIALDQVRDETAAARRKALAEVLSPDGDRQTDARLEALEASFRTLKLAMEDTRARLSESRFFKMELRARRRRRDPEVPGWERFASMAYGMTADYGDSIARPVVFFAATGLAFALAYWGLAALEAGSAPSWDNLGDALRYSLSRMTPFGALQEQGRWVWLSGWQDEGSLFSWAGLIRITATVQSALALVLTFLFALAVRRRFQIV